MSSLKYGDLVKGHFCHECIVMVDEPIRGQENKENNLWCLKCGHKGIGLKSTATVGHWLILCKTVKQDIGNPIIDITGE